MESKNKKEYHAFLTRFEQQLTSKEYSLKRNISILPYQIDLIASKSSFEASKFGKMTRTISFTSMENVNTETIQEFSKYATKYALDNRDSLLPRGLGGSLLSIPVIISRDFDIELRQWMEKNLVKKHWAAFEFPVLISLKDQEIYYCKKTPIWGAAYYSGFRKFVETNLSF